MVRIFQENLIIPTRIIVALARKQPIDQNSNHNGNLSIKLIAFTVYNVHDVIYNFKFLLTYQA